MSTSDPRVEALYHLQDALNCADEGEGWQRVERARTILAAALDASPAPYYNCPDAEVCKTCPCAGEDDVCFPGERLRADLEQARKAPDREKVAEAMDAASGYDLLLKPEKWLELADAAIAAMRGGNESMADEPYSDAKVKALQERYAETSDGLYIAWQDERAAREKAEAELAAMRSGAPPPSDSVEALERVAREWLADLSPHGADVGEDAAMMATELLAALDAVPADEDLRERVYNALAEAECGPDQDAFAVLADAAIAALRGGPDG